MSNTPTNYPRRRGKLNRSTMTVKLAFNHMKFDAVVEWVKAYQELNSINPETSSEHLELVKTKFKALEKVFEHMFPKVKEIDQATAEAIETESEEVQELTTDAIIEELNNATKPTLKA